MKTIFKWLVPGFIHRLDRALLENYPVVWRTRGHYVLYFSVLLIPILFLLGFVNSVSLSNLTVDPRNHIIFFYDTYNKGMLGILSIGLLYWAYTQYQIGFPSARWKDIALTLIIYSVGIFVMLAIAAPMFRLGTIVRTAYFFIDEKDLDSWSAENFYSYGFIFNDSDTFNINPHLLNQYFQEREKDVDNIRKIEERVLQRRYDIAYIDSINLILEKDLNHRSIQMEYSYKENLQYLRQRSYVPKPEFIFNSLVNFIAYWSYLPTLEQNLSDNRKDYYKNYPNFKNYRSYRYNTLFRGMGITPSQRFYYQDWRLYNQYYIYYKQKSPILSRRIIDKYDIPTGVDTIQIDTLKFLLPQLPYSLENGYRSVQHARQFIKQGIHFWHYKTFLYYLPFITLLLFAAPFLSFRMALGALALAAIGTGLNIGLDFSSAFLKYWYYWHSLVYLILPCSGLLLLIFAATVRKQLAFVSFAFHLIVLGVLIILFLALYGDKGIFHTTALTINKPVDLAFYGVQIIGLAGMMLMAYIQALPRR
ncbi:MAG: hypothetical protein KDD14_01300 [Saprospiraceae bacterium]|nr:hypothetical protein [Saprospiraceae bacterium]